MVLLLLLNLFFWALSSLISLATFIIFRTVSLAIVLFIQLFRVPGLAIEGALDHIARLSKAVLEYVVELLKDGLVSLISSGFQLMTATTTGSVTLTASAITELVEKSKTALDGLAEIFPEVFDGVSDMVVKAVWDFWDNYRGAVGYIIQNI